jgi:hypothetical protein
MFTLRIHDEIANMLVRNSIVYCVRRGEKKIWARDGTVRYYPLFEAVGLSTEYYRDYKNWRSNTVIFATSNEELYKRIKDAQRKGYQ